MKRGAGLGTAQRQRQQHGQVPLESTEAGTEGGYLSHKPSLSDSEFLAQPRILPSHLCPKAISFRAPWHGQDATHDISWLRDPPSLASSASRGHKSGPGGARLGSRSVPQILTKQSQGW